jgi:nucleotide-binding universal stress UspA family protein
MTLLVGVAPERRARAVLDLAAMLARTDGDDLLVTSIVPAPWAPGPARVDAEYQAELQGLAQAALDDARQRLPEGARYVVHHARSVPSGLVEVAERNDARMLVLGSAISGALGYVHLGSTTDGLVHSSPIPVALAPRGFRCRGNCPVKRLTAAFGGADDRVVAAAADIAGRIGASLRVASFVVRQRAPIQAGVGTETERAIAAQWERDVRSALGEDHELVIGRGTSWDVAIDDIEWEDGDVLLVGSSSVGPVARVFLGSRAAKIVRNSPVPVVVVPRS